MLIFLGSNYELKVLKLKLVFFFLTVLSFTLGLVAAWQAISSNSHGPNIYMKPTGTSIFFMYIQGS